MSFKINDYTKSREMFERAEKVIPSGISTPPRPQRKLFHSRQRVALLLRRQSAGLPTSGMLTATSSSTICALTVRMSSVTAIPDVDAAALEQG